MMMLQSFFPSLFSLSCVAVVVVQAQTGSSGGPPFSNLNASATFSSPTTATGNISLLVVTATVNLEDYWNQAIGPVTIASINTTVQATPVPSSDLVPPPPLYYRPLFSDAQVPLAVKNESWSFPKNFWWGVDSAAYQVEGAVKDEGRGPTLWDALTHRVVGYTVTNDTGDVANNHYYLYKQDIARIAALGAKAYSFSIAWSRIFPFGKGDVNELGLTHYDDVINTCLDYGIEPIVTLYHWDLPLYLQNLYGGWLSEDIVDDFAAYAQVVFERYGGKVKKWITFNEPHVFCDDYPLPKNYFTTTTIPDIQQPYYCGQNVILAHAKAYHLGKSLGLETIAFKNNGGYKMPLTNSSGDAIAVQRAWDFQEGWFADPIYLTGDYPQSVKDYVSTFLRPFTEDEKASINGTADLFAHDAYTAQFYFEPDDGLDACLANSSNPLFPSCANTSYTYADADGGWDVGPAADPLASWLHKATDWVPALLHYIQDTWKPVGGIAISEFGFAEPFESQKVLLGDIRADLYRVAYFREYMEAILLAMSEGVNVVGTMAWSIYDNLEWSSGYNVKFGLQYCNFTTQQRVFKASAFEYVNIFKVYQET